jgi:hypothetical protein
MADAAPAKEQLRRQLERVLATETLETLPAAMVPELVAQPPALGLRRKRRLPSLKGLSPLGRKE